MSASTYTQFSLLGTSNLVINGFITEEQRSAGLATWENLIRKAQKEKQEPPTLAQVLVDLGYLSPEQRAEALHRKLKLPRYALEKRHAISQRILACIPAQLAQTYQLVPLKLDWFQTGKTRNRLLVLGFYTFEHYEEALEAINNLHPHRFILDPVICTQPAIRANLAKYYS